jgi:glycine/D-amino acid oxidase-like deaminating enzyme/nitrite reductase/ring-hydroxylating ferredoxin subunit
MKTLDDVIWARSAALTFIRERISEYDIDCGYTNVPWCYCTVNEDDIKEVENEQETMKYAGLPAFSTTPVQFPFKVKSIALLEDQAQFNPLQYVKKLAAEIEGEQCWIFENTRVTNIKDGDLCLVETTGGTITAGKVVQATHTPKGLYAVHALMEVYREYAVAVQLNQEAPAGGIYWIRDGKNKYSIRPYTTHEGHFAIVINETQKLGHKERTEENFENLERYIRSVFDVGKAKYLWAAQKYVPADYLPYIGTSPMQKNVYIATGFEADGLIWGTAASIIISDLITGKYNPSAQTFDPKRFTPIASAENALKENIHVASHLIKDYIKGTEKEFHGIPTGEGMVIDFNGKKSAAYRDEEGMLHIVSAICPHMGCIVHWNSAERSWDCPCHGSRFTYTGEVLEGPAIGGLHNYRDTQE